MNKICIFLVSHYKILFDYKLWSLKWPLAIGRRLSKLNALNGTVNKL